MCQIHMAAGQSQGAGQRRGYSKTNGWHFSNQCGDYREVRERESNSTGSGGEHDRDAAVRKAQSLPDLRATRTSSLIWTLDLRPLQERGGGGDRLQETPDQKRGWRPCFRSIEGLCPPRLQSGVFALTRYWERVFAPSFKIRMVGLDGTDGYCCQHGWILVCSLRL